MFRDGSKPKKVFDYPMKSPFRARSQHPAADTTNQENIFSSRFSSLCAFIITALFVVVVSFNLLYPSPSGPADNGDFARIFGSFSSGPLGHDFWPPC